MKKYLLIGTMALLLSACTNQSEVDNTRHQRDSLLAVVNQRDSSLNDFITSFIEIESNLDAVAARQNILNTSTTATGELKQNAKDRINAEIAAINNLMDENRKKIAGLNSKLKNSDNRNAQLQKMIRTLTEQLTEKDRELAVLNEKLAGLDSQLGQLQTSVDTLTRTIATQTTTLHTAYYVIGKSKDLQEAKIIDRTGGVLGIGRSSRLSSHFDNSKFTRVDYTQMGVIPVESKSVKIVTTHPSDSYSLDKDSKNVIKNIVITDPQKFWSASKYLVVVRD